MEDTEIDEILNIMRARLKRVNTKKVPQDEAKVIPIRVQYPLKGFDFFIPSISFYGNYQELEAYEPFGMYELDDEHKRRRKPSLGHQICMFLDPITWSTLKQEAERTSAGYKSKVIENIIKENKELKAENEDLHRALVKVLQK